MTRRYERQKQKLFDLLGPQPPRPVRPEYSCTHEEFERYATAQKQLIDYLRATVKFWDAETKESIKSMRKWLIVVMIFGVIAVVSGILGTVFR